jgi:RNA polymerase sigma factor (sigma-70 family)
MMHSEQVSFSGTVMVYGKPVYLDLATGQGVDEILSRMSGFIEAFGRWSTQDGALEESDLRQEAYAAAMEGMRSYDPSRRAQLSTFLQSHIRNRMIDVCRRVRPVLLWERGTTGMLEEGIDIRRALRRWGERWSRIMTGMFVEGRTVSEMAEREGLTPWGLSRALRRRLELARKELDV